MHIAALHQPSQVQLNQDGNLKHFLTIEGLSCLLYTSPSPRDPRRNLVWRLVLENGGGGG
ncbi:hypothetical protein ACN6QZ_17805, partial [Acinetobacter baumannii]